MNKAKLGKGGWITFKCPACAASQAVYGDGQVYDLPGQHSVRVKPHHQDGWGFNGDLESPTLTPSLRVRYGEELDYQCHFFVRNGQIQYCGDSTHALAGKTVPMEDMEP